MSSEDKLPIPKKRRRWLSVLLGILILVCGFVLGSGVTVVVVYRHVVHAIHHPEDAPRRISQRMQRRFGLTDDQTARVRKILAKRQKGRRSIYRNTWPKLDQELNRIESEVTEVLDDKQASKWRKRFKIMRNKWIPAPAGDTKARSSN